MKLMHAEVFDAGAVIAPLPDTAQPMIARLWRDNVCAEKLEVYAGNVRRPEPTATCAPRRPVPRISSPANSTTGWPNWSPSALRQLRQHPLVRRRRHQPSVLDPEDHDCPIESSTLTPLPITHFTDTTTGAAS
jgi:hypothetical protein